MRHDATLPASHPCLLLGLVGLGLASALPKACGQAAPFLKQERNGSEAQPMSATEQAELGDPLFRLALEAHPREGNLKRLIALLAGEAPPVAEEKTRPQLFIVHEDIASAARTKPDGTAASRRAVMAFAGSGTQGVELTGNVMISFFIRAKKWVDAPGGLEAWGWDEARGRYNYYRFDGSPATWRFRASSVDADLKTPGDRAETCLACHVNGGPVMKEMIFPWNNWFSSEMSAANYLKAGDANAWPIAEKPPFKSRLATAEKLETQLLSSIHNFNRKRLTGFLKHDPATGEPLFAETGGQRRGTVVQANRLLRGLFETTEVNLTSARDPSGRHPLEARSDSLPTNPLRLFPASSMVNARLLAGDSTTGYRGLGMSVANDFAAAMKITRKEYRDLVDGAGIQWRAQPGDTHFAWFGPEPSHIDNDLLDQALRLGAITPHFLAATLAVDFERPVFSERRASLLRHVPAEFSFVVLPEDAVPAELPRDAANDELTRNVISSLVALSPVKDSAEAEWLAHLRSDDATARLRTLLGQRLKALRRDLNSPTAGRREAALKALFSRLIEARKALLDHKVLGALDETINQGLLPLPPAP